MAVVRVVLRAFDKLITESFQGEYRFDSEVGARQVRASHEYLRAAVEVSANLYKRTSSHFRHTSIPLIWCW